MWIMNETNCWRCYLQCCLYEVEPLGTNLSDLLPWMSRSGEFNLISCCWPVLSRHSRLFESHQPCLVFKLLLIVAFPSRFLSKDFGRSSSLTENSHVLRVLILIISCLQAELNMTDKPNGSGISSHIPGSASNKNTNTWDMEISAFSMVEDILCKIASTISENLWQSVVEVSSHVSFILTGASH